MRQRSSDRLDQVIAAALRVFGAKGYRRTQMADVAREMGVSPGTLYNYVVSKEALFHLVIDRAFLKEPDTRPPTLPITTPPPGATLRRLRERLRAEAIVPALEAALTRPRVADPQAELEAIVRDLYALVERSRQGIVVLERSALELPELASVFYVEMRRGLVARLDRYLTSRIKGRRLRPVPYPAATARLILENVAMFAVHRHRDPDPTGIDDTAARETVVHLIVSALTLARSGTARVKKEQRR